MCDEMRTYIPSSCAVFCKTKEKFGGYSNMCAGYPLRINGIKILTSEALYQACRFPMNPEIQKEIIAQKSPMSAKMKSKKHRDTLTRLDWDNRRVTIMRWCLRVKLLQNWKKFSLLLLSSEDLMIVEKSTKKDFFWGAVEDENGILIGQNILGRLLMELREGIKNNSDPMSFDFQKLLPLPLENFLLYGEPIEITIRP